MRTYAVGPEMQITRLFSVADCAQDLLRETAPLPPAIATSTSFFEFPSKAMARFGNSWWVVAGRSSAGDVAIPRTKSNSSPWQARIGNTVDGLLMEFLLRRHEVEFFLRSYLTLVKKPDTCTVPAACCVDACLSCNVVPVQQECAAEVPTLPYTKDKAMMTLPFLHEHSLRITQTCCCHSKTTDSVSSTLDDRTVNTPYASRLAGCPPTGSMWRMQTPAPFYLKWACSGSCRVSLEGPEMSWPDVGVPAVDVAMMYSRSDLQTACTWPPQCGHMIDLSRRLFRRGSIISFFRHPAILPTQLLQLPFFPFFDCM